MQAVQRPDVLGMPARADHARVEAQIRPVHRLRLRRLALLEQQRAEGMAGRLHPPPGLVVGQVVLETHRLAQVNEGGVETPSPVLDLAARHLRGDLEYVPAGVVEEEPGPGDARSRRLEALPVRLRGRDVAGRGVRHRLRVEDERGGHPVEIVIGGQRLVDDLLPHSESDESVHLHPAVALQDVGHGRALDAKQGLRKRRDHLVRGLHRGAMLAEEHRPVELEMGVVDARVRVHVERPLACHVLVIGDERGGVAHHDVVIVPALEVDVGRHVVEMARVRHQAVELIARPQRLLRVGRHLHQVDVEVQQTGMGRAALLFHLPERPFEDLLRLQGAGALHRLAGAQIPQLPRRTSHDGVGKEDGDIQIPGPLPVGIAHRARIVFDP